MWGIRLVCISLMIRVTCRYCFSLRAENNKFRKPSMKARLIVLQLVWALGRLPVRAQVRRQCCCYIYQRCQWARHIWARFKSTVLWPRIEQMVRHQDTSGQCIKGTSCNFWDLLNYVGGFACLVFILMRWPFWLCWAAFECCCWQWLYLRPVWTSAALHTCNDEPSSSSPENQFKAVRGEESDRRMQMSYSLCMYNSSYFKVIAILMGSSQHIEMYQSFDSEHGGIIN